MSGTITEVIETTTATEEGEETTVVEPEPLSARLGQGFAAVDNSGSTGGEPLRIAEAFTNALGVGRVSLWNSRCSPPVPRESVTWVSTGGTYPSTIFEPQNHVSARNIFVFMVIFLCMYKSKCIHT